jgi:hypothetical protein
MIPVKEVPSKSTLPPRLALHPGLNNVSLLPCIIAAPSLVRKHG